MTLESQVWDCKFMMWVPKFWPFFACPVASLDGPYAGELVQPDPYFGAWRGTPIADYCRPHAGGYAYYRWVVFGPSWLKWPARLAIKAAALKWHLAWWLVENCWIHCEEGGVIQFRNLTWAPKERAWRDKHYPRYVVTDEGMEAL